MIADASDVCYGYESSEEVSNFNSASNSASAARSASFPRVPTPGLPALAKEEASRHASPRDGDSKSPSPARAQPRAAGANHLESALELRERLAGLAAALRQKDGAIAELEKRNGAALRDLELKCNENDRLAAAHEGVQHELASAREECSAYTAVIQQKCSERTATQRSRLAESRERSAAEEARGVTRSTEGKRFPAP
ncbi:hypothetical protein DIPPA_15185 [Diplonema papillatum]|nr:hypothetical protein DIPPA_15185 [Diplonema papillatum]